MLSYALDDEPVKVWVPSYLGEFKNADGSYREIMSYLRRKDVIIKAHNAEFEMSINKNVCEQDFDFPPIPVSRYSCTAALCASLALPRALEKAAKMVLKNIRKDPKGQILINRFCRPRKPSKNNPKTRIAPTDSPEEFEEFIEYCRQDTVTERALARRLRKFKLSRYQQKMWELNTEMNFRGIPLDIKTIKNSLEIVEEYTKKLTKECNHITGGLNPTQRDKLLQWINSNGLDIENLQADTIDKALHYSMPWKIRRVLEIRKSISHTSTKKLQTMLKVRSEDNVFRGGFLFHGATTGRASGKLVQPHNFAKPSINDVEGTLDLLQWGGLDELEIIYKDPLEAISSCLRGMICAPDGYKITVADYKAIEARILCWIAGQNDILKLFRSGADPYVDMAAYVFNIYPDEVTKDDRNLGKQIVLGCGYQMGPDRFLETCLGYGISIDLELAKKAVYAYRRKYKRVKQFWYDVEVAAVRAIKTGQKVYLRNLCFYVEDIFLFIVLPSGRKLAYPFPQMKMKRTDWGEIKETITFIGSISGSVHWGENTTYGGKIVENIVQGIAFDLMTDGMEKAINYGYPIIMTIHDELASLVKENFGSVEEFESVVCNLRDWAQGIPLVAEGYEAKRYRKQ